MNFLAPAAFAFAAAIPVVIVFYLLKRKRVVKLVSSTMIWQKFLAETQASSPFQRLRRNWLLFLQLLLLILAIFALARPYFDSPAREGRLWVVVLDASASMRSTDESPSRFEKARREALRMVDALGDTDQMLILLAGAITEVKQSATGNKSDLRRALQASGVSDSPTRLVEALKTAESLVRDKPLGEIHLFSDGAVADWSEFEAKGLPLTWHRVGQRSRNAALVTLDVRPNPENPSQRAIYAGVANYSTNAMTVELELLFEDELVDARPLTLAPSETVPQVFLVSQESDGVFTARLRVEDDLASDNEASVVSLMPKPVKVLLVSRGNPMLEKALRVAGNVELTVAADFTGDGAAYDLAVLDDVTPSVWPPVNLLGFHVVNTNWFDGFSEVEGPAIVDWDVAHPVLRYVGLDNVFVAKSLAVNMPSWAIPLVESQQTPLILAGEPDRRQVLWVGFDLWESNWPLRVSFPIFIANAVNWLNPAAANEERLRVRAGDPFRLNLVEPVTEARVTRPDGTTVTLEIPPDAREIVFGNTDERGVYRMRMGTNETVFAANVLDSMESNTQPRESLDFGRFGEVEATAVRKANLELWRWIAAAALAVLLFEWWFYHRRTV